MEISSAATLMEKQRELWVDRKALGWSEVL